MTASDLPPLAYGRRPGRRWRRWLALAAVATMVVAGVRWRKPILAEVAPRWVIARLHWAEHGCLTYTPPPDRWVYDDTSPAATPDVGDESYAASIEWFGNNTPSISRRTVAVGTPAVWRSYLAQVSQLDTEWPVSPNQFEPTFGISSGLSTPPRGAAFLHERTTPGGRPELVCVSVCGGDEIALEAYAWRPGSFVRVMSPIAPADESVAGELALRRAQPSDHVRLFAGRPDPADPSRFTIDGDYNGRSFTIEGRVGDDDRVTMRPTSGWAGDDDGGKRLVWGGTWLISGHEEDLVDDAPPVTTWPVPHLYDSVLTCDGLRFTADGRAVVIVTAGRAVQVGVADGRVAWEGEVPDGAAFGTVLAPDGRSAATAAAVDGPARLFALPGMRELMRGVDVGGCRVALSPTVMTEATDHGVVWWNLARRSVRRRWRTDATVLAAVPTAFGQSVVVTAVALPPTNPATIPTQPADAEAHNCVAVTALLFDATADGPVRAVPIGTVVDATPAGLADAGANVKVSPDGRYLSMPLDAGDPWDGAQQVTDLWAGRPVHDGPMPGGGSRDRQFSADGQLLAWANGSVFVLDVPAGRLHRLSGTKQGAVAFSPDGRAMAGVWNDALHVWPTPAR